MRLAALALALALAATLAAAETGARRVEFTAPDGVPLVATSWSPGRPGPGVLLLHMCNSDRSAWNGLGARLAARGFHALALDYRGFGESGGERNEQDAAAQQRIVDGQWPGDVDAALAYLRAQPGVASAPVGAAGGSCGVNQAVQLARRHPEVRALALLSGNVNREGEDFLDANPWLPLFAAAAGDDDGSVPTMRWVTGFSTHPSNRRLEYAAGGHGTEMFAAHADLEPAIVDFFEQFLVRHPATVAPAAVAGTSPSAQVRDELLAPGAAARLRARLATAKSPQERPELPPEAVLIFLGYNLLQSGDAANAIEIFEVAVAAHPGSANAHDSLGDAYLAAGDRQRARAEAEKALAALDGDSSLDPERRQLVSDSARAKLAPPVAAKDR